MVENLTDPVVKQFWIDEFGKYSSNLKWKQSRRFKTKLVNFYQSHDSQYRRPAKIQHSYARRLWIARKYLIMNLSKGRIGEDSSALIGAMLITKIQQAAMSGLTFPKKSAHDFSFMLMSFKILPPESFAGILSEARKYRLDFDVGASIY